MSFAYCFLATCCDLYLQYKSSENVHWLTISNLVFFVLYLIVVCMPVKTERHEEDEPSFLSRYCGEDHTLGVAEDHKQIFSRLFFVWVQPLMLKGYNKELNSVEDLFDLPNNLHSADLNEKIALFSLFDEGNNEIGNILCWSYFKKSFLLVKYLHTLFSLEFYLLGLLKFVSDCLSFGGPLLLNVLVEVLESPEKNIREGYFYAFCLLAVTSTSTILSVQYNYLINRIGLKMKSSLLIFIYKKTLLLNQSIISSKSTGEIMNYLSTDVERIINFCQSFHLLWSLPLQVIVILVLLYQQVKYCFFIGIIFILIIIPINQYVAKKIAVYSSLMMKAKDKRIKVINEIINGIRIIKMNVWESIFLRKINFIRGEEVKFLRKRKYLDAVCVFFWATTPVIMPFLTFSLYAVLGFQFTASKIFTSVALFNILIMPLNAFPWILNGIVEAWISVKRVNDFLLLPILDIEKYYLKIDNGKVLEITNGLFTHSQEAEAAFLVGPIDLELHLGEFLCIFGKVGSGKSSILSSILADLKCVSGQVKTNVFRNGRGFGYVSQSSWIQHKSIKENILFGENFNVLKYRKVLEACALIEDLQALPSGDNTEVGDKGVTLSGGQKTRISLARAIYMDFDVYLMDDIFSAIDVHVADHIYTNCIMGILKNKTRVLCTHKSHFAENSDFVITLSNGKIVSQGPPSQVLQSYLMREEDMGFDDRQTHSIPVQFQFDQSEKINTLVEEKEDGVVKLHVYKFYWKSVGTILPVVVLVFCFLMQASRTTSDWWLSFWVSKSHSTPNSSFLYEETLYDKKKQHLYFYLYIYGGLALSNCIFTFFRAFLFAWAGIKAALLLHDDLVRNIIKATTSFFDVTPLGRIVNRFSSDIYCIDDTFPFILNILLAQVFALAGCIFITCYALPWMLIIIALLSVIYFKIQRYYRWTSRELKRLSNISLSPIYAHMAETLNGLTTIRVMASTSRFLKDMMQLVDHNIQACLSLSAASQWLNLRLQFIGVTIITSVALIAMFQKQFGNVDAGLVGLALSYALSVTALLNGAIIAFTETEKEIISVERVEEYVKKVKSETSDCSQMPPFAWPSHGVIYFLNVSLCYRPSCPYSLKDISFETSPGEKIGIVGRTGSGKTSLIQVLYRMADCTKGSVFIDGVNIANLSLEKLRCSLSVIPQDPFLFSGNLRENLDPYQLKSDVQIWKALQDCHLEEKIRSLGGLYVEVQEQGENFSVGEKQLLCLARALLRKSKIVCMDEATASVDYETDSLIRHTVRLAFQRSTVLVIAHRMETVLDCDRVIVMKDGQIAEMGKPATLLSNSDSEFYKLVYYRS